MAYENNQRNQVAVIQPPRMQMPAEVQKRYGLDPDRWRALTEAVFPLAKTVGAVVMALAYCEQRHLDVFARVVHIVPMRIGNREVETVWPGIGLQRITAQRQDDFDGWDDCAFGSDVTRVFKGKKRLYDRSGKPTGYEDVEATVTFPEWAQFTFYKVRHGRRLSLPGPKTWFLETYSPLSPYVEVPNARWCRAPRQMLEKCAEAAALRRGWPDVFGDEATFEEVEGRASNGVPLAEYVEVADNKPDAPATPRRADFAGGGASVQDTDPDLDEDDRFLQGDLAEDAEFVDEGPSLAEQAEAGQASADETDPAWVEWQASVEAALRKATSQAQIDRSASKAAATQEWKDAPAVCRDQLDILYRDLRDKLPAVQPDQTKGDAA